MSKTQILEKFRYFDDNGDGKIDVSELAFVIKSLDPLIWTDDRVKELFCIMDTNMDWRISYSEFVDFIFGHRWRRQQRQFQGTLRKIPDGETGKNIEVDAVEDTEAEAVAKAETEAVVATEVEACATATAEADLEAEAEVGEPAVAEAEAEAESEAEAQTKVEVEVKVQAKVECDEDLADLGEIVRSFGQYHDLEKIQDIFENVEKVDVRLKLAAGRESTNREQLEALQNEWAPFSNLWVPTHNWLMHSKKWLHGPFDQIDAQHCAKSVPSWCRSLHKAVRSFTKRSDCEKVLKIAENMRMEMDEFMPSVALVEGMRNKGMRSRHWAQISDLVGIEVYPGMKDFTLSRFHELGLLAHAMSIADIGDRSGKEFDLECALEKMRQDWVGLSLGCSDLYRKSETYILRDLENVLVLFQEHMIITEAMLKSQFNRPIRHAIDEWHSTLLSAEGCLSAWLDVQRSWIYLQDIIDSPTMMAEFPEECEKFKSVDTQWRQEMNHIHRQSPVNALTCLSKEGLKEKWESCKNDLELLSKSARVGEIKEDLRSKRDS